MFGNFRGACEGMARPLDTVQEREHRHMLIEAGIQERLQREREKRDRLIEAGVHNRLTMLGLINSFGNGGFDAN